MSQYTKRVMVGQEFIQIKSFGYMADILIRQTLMK